MQLLKNQVLDKVFWAISTLVFCQATLVCLVYLTEPMDGYTRKGLVISGKYDSRASGLEIGDRVVSIGGLHVNADPPRFSSILTALKSKPGSSSYQVERRGELVSATVPLFRMNVLTFLSLVGVNLFLCLFFAMTAATLYLRTAPRSLARSGNRNLYKSARVVCCCLVIGGGNIISFTRGVTGIDSEALRALGVPLILTYGITFGLLLHFFLIFPTRPNLMSRKWWAPAAFHATHLSLSIPATLLVLFGPGEGGSLYRGRLFLGGIYTLLAVVAAFKSYRDATSPVVRNQMRWIAWGISLGLGPWFFLYLLPTVLGRPALVDARITLLFMAVIPLSLLVAISRYKLLEIDGLIRRSLVYTVLMSAMTASYVLAVVIGTWLTGRGSAGLSSAAAAAIVVSLFALAFRPIKSISERLVTRAFYRNITAPSDARAMLSQAISQVIRLPEIASLMIENAARAFASSGAALIVFDDQGETKSFATSDGLTLQLARNGARFRAALQSRPDLWSRVVYPAIDRDGPDPTELPEGFAVCFPLLAADRLVGAYLLSGKLSNWLYTREEIDTLRSLTHQASTAVVNALTYDRMNNLNAELESLVELRTGQLVETNSVLESRNAELLLQNTELERLLKELKETQAALLTAERRAAVGEIVIAICHEINNPLTAIIAQTELIDLQKESTPDRVLDRVRVIEQCADKIRVTTERLRSLDNPTSTDYVAGIRMIDLKPLEKPGPLKPAAETGGTNPGNRTKRSGSL
ncbi:MAG: histidine kinase dimerization/phospho-acceptor domain-containing protein [Blastocatellia bacterium]